MPDRRDIIQLIPLIQLVNTGINSGIGTSINSGIDTSIITSINIAVPGGEGTLSGPVTYPYFSRNTFLRASIGPGLEETGKKEGSLATYPDYRCPLLRRTEINPTMGAARAKCREPYVNTIVEKTLAYHEFLTTSRTSAFSLGTRI